MSWQFCQTHFRRHLTQATPAYLREVLHGALGGLLRADSEEEAWAQTHEVFKRLEERDDRPLESLEPLMNHHKHLRCA